MLDGWKEKAFRLVAPIYTIFTKSAEEGAQTTLATLFYPPDKMKNGGYYSDCHISRQNKHVTKENWDKLW